MVPQLETRVEPHVESFYSFIYLSSLVQLLFIHKTDGWDFLFSERREQLRCHLVDFGCGHPICRPGRQIVYGDGDLAIGSNARQTCSGKNAYKRNCVQPCTRLHGGSSPGDEKLKNGQEITSSQVPLVSFQ